MKRFITILLLVSSVRTLRGQGSLLKDLRAVLVPMRARHTERLEMRGATPELTLAKHRLRDWIESRLPALKWDGDPGTLERELNRELRQAGLMCSDGAECEESELGFLSDVKLRDRQNGSFLVVQSGVGILCGFDDSAYVYRWAGDRWQRIWESEQNDYRERRYFPQSLQTVLISPLDYSKGADRSEHLIVTLGVNPWCTSNWQSVYYRVWQTKSAYEQPKLLLDEHEIAFSGDDSLHGSAGIRDVLIEYAVGSLDVGVHNRSEVRHYVLDQDRLRRVDPIALSPRDFVDEWLSHPWPESSDWTEPAVRSALEKRHSKREAHSEFINPTCHCEQRPDLWQVAIAFNKPEYFLVRWRPPYHFTMVDISATPWPDCTQEDPEADEARTLFPQSGRQQR